MSQQLIFVYGTLRRGGRLGHVLGKDQLYFDDPIRVEGLQMRAVSKSFPAVRQTGRTEDVVTGELYSVSGTMIRRLDQIEDVGGGMYRRVQIDVGEGLEAWVYVWGVNEKMWQAAPVITSGDWINR